MYDFSRDLDDVGKKNLRDFVESGGGVVVFHHALLDYQNWDWWTDQAVGGSYRLSREGDSPSSSVKNNQQISVTPAESHPVTAGIGPFHIEDETYKNMRFSPKVRPLLTTDHPTSDTSLAWLGPDDRLSSRRNPARPRPHGVQAILPIGPWSTTPSSGRPAKQVAEQRTSGSACASSRSVLTLQRTGKDDQDEDRTLQHHLPGPLVSRRGTYASRR